MTSVWLFWTCVKCYGNHDFHGDALTSCVPHLWLTRESMVQSSAKWWIAPRMHIPFTCRSLTCSSILVFILPSLHEGNAPVLWLVHSSHKGLVIWKPCHVMRSSWRTHAIFSYIYVDIFHWIDKVYSNFIRSDFLPSRNLVKSVAFFFILSLQWRHNGRDGISNHQPPDCLLKRLFRRRS